MLRRVSIQVVLILLFVAALALMAVALQASNTVRQREALVVAQRHHGETLISSVSSVIEAVSPLITTLQDITELDARLAVLVEQNKHVDFISVSWPDGTVLFHSDPAYKFAVVEALGRLNPDATERATIRGMGEVYLTSAQFENPTEIGPETYFITVGVAAEEIDASLQDAVVSAVYIGGVVFLVVLVAVLIVLQFGVNRPVRRLQQAAQAFSAGQLDYRLTPGGPRELHQLGNTLNQMATELEQINRTLEDRVEARMRDVNLAAQVAQQVATTFDPDQLLNQVVEAVKETFDLYHAHVYLLDDAGDNLVLAAGAGEAGRVMKERGHSISAAAETSLVARCAREKSAVVVPDTTTDPTFLPNALLPETRSEAAVPLLLGTRVLGVLDVQSEQRNRFDADLVKVLNTMANQIAVAVDNARLFTTMERNSRHQQALSAVSQALQSAQNINDVLQIAARELGRALRVPYTAIELKLETEPKPAKARREQPVAESA